MTAGELRSFPLLKALDDEQLERLGPWLEPAEFPAGACIFREGSPAEALLLVASGTVLLESRRCERAARAKTGSALGGASLLAAGARETTAIAETACDLLLLRETAFQSLIDEAPELACRLACAIGSELAASARQNLEVLADE